MNVIDRFRKYRKGGILLSFRNGGGVTTLPAIDSSLEGVQVPYVNPEYTSLLKRDPILLFDELVKINPRAHNKDTFLKAYENMRNVYWGLKNQGLSNEEVSGIMGNILAENTTFDPDLTNSGGYKGIVQLSKDNQKYVTSNYGDLSLDSQLKFIGDWTKGIVYEKDPSNSGYGYNRYVKRVSDTPSGFAKAWSDHFERHGGGSSLRQKYANMFYNYFNN